jgi:ATP-binding cassette subfamily B (MDR/TAP) protein 1
VPCSTADRLDYILMIVGTLGAAGNGAAWPIFAVLFSKFTDAFGGSSPNFLDQVRS